jgi:hyperosmotically inducible periplasmic protein
MAKFLGTKAVAFAILGILLSSSISSAQQNEPKAGQNLIKEVRHQLVLLPYYSVFDNLSYRVEGSKVVLGGQVVRAIYSEPSLSRYAASAVPSIHIIVKGQHVSLVGVADNATDKNIAGLKANGVPNVFSVDNNLVVDSDAK